MCLQPKECIFCNGEYFRQRHCVAPGEYPSCHSEFRSAKQERIYPTTLSPNVSFRFAEGQGTKLEMALEITIGNACSTIGKICGLISVFLN